MSSMEPVDTGPYVQRGDWAFSQLARADVACPSTVSDLAAAVAAGRTPFAGATDLLIRSLHSGGKVPPLVWTQSVPELNEVGLAGDRLRIGAGAAAGAVAASPEIRSRAPALADAVLLLGSVQIRSRATVVGNVCNASPAADTVPALAVHGTVVRLRRGEEQRVLPLAEFLTGPGATAMRPSEFVVGIELEGLGKREASSYRRFTVRESMDLAFVGVGVRLEVAADARTIERARIALGAVGPTFVEAMEAGAALANMTSFWGQPAMLDPEVDFEGNLLYQMGTARSAKGVILVNRNGKRFVNEGVTYQDFPKALGAYDPVALEYPTENVWMIFDQNTKDATVLLPSILPGGPAPEWMTRAETVRDLADEIGVSPDALEATVTRWNEHVAAGEDPDFHRGTVRFESHMSGHFPTPEHSLGAVATAPFYAMPLYDGTLGTNGGPRIDADARVLRHDGKPIPGLYAAGNASASVFGPAYPGGGATIGPALTFGYLAGRHAASREATTRG